MTGALQRRTDKMRNGPGTVFVQHRGRDEGVDGISFMGLATRSGGFKSI